MDLLELLMGDASSTAGPSYTHTIQPEPALRWVREDGSDPTPPLRLYGDVLSGTFTMVDADGDRCFLSE